MIGELGLGAEEGEIFGDGQLVKGPRVRVKKLAVSAARSNVDLPSCLDVIRAGQVWKKFELGEKSPKRGIWKRMDVVQTADKALSWP